MHAGGEGNGGGVDTNGGGCEGGGGRGGGLKTRVRRLEEQVQRSSAPTNAVGGGISNQELRVLRRSRKGRPVGVFASLERKTVTFAKSLMGTTIDEERERLV